MKIYVETSVIDPTMIKKLHHIEAMTGADITVNIREIVTYADNSSDLDLFPMCTACGLRHPITPSIPCKETI